MIYVHHVVMDEKAVGCAQSHFDHWCAVRTASARLSLGFDDSIITLRKVSSGCGTTHAANSAPASKSDVRKRQANVCPSFGMQIVTVLSDSSIGVDIVRWGAIMRA